MRKQFAGAALGLALTGAAGAAYMLWESQWLERRERDLAVPGLPPALEGLTVLHLSDVHAGQPGLNLRSLRKAVEWAEERKPDLVFLTGDILGGRRGGRKGLALLSRLRPRLGAFAVKGNHEYGLSKNPLAHRPLEFAWREAGIVQLEDQCVLVPYPEAGGPDADGKGPGLALCGADYLTGGHGLKPPEEEGFFPVLLIHRPPGADNALQEHFRLAFAGHTHGGQIRLPSPWGLWAPHREGLPYLEGIQPWGSGLVVVSRGIGTTFLPLRLLTRPQATIYRLRSAG